MSLKTPGTSGNLLCPSAPLAAAEQLPGGTELFARRPHGGEVYKAFWWLERQSSVCMVSLFLVIFSKVRTCFHVTFDL